MKLIEICKEINVIELLGNPEATVSILVSDSRKAIAGTCFVAIKGTKVDAHDFVLAVYEKGCRTFVLERKVELPSDATQVIVSDSAFALGTMAHTFYGNPSHSLQLIGITGTNGKTTSTTLLHNLFGKLGYKVGLISTVVNKIGNEEIPSTHTTPDPISLNELLADMVEQGCSHCFMEVSSHAVSQHRIAGLKFQIAAFTNITHDHLDYHGTFKAYIEAKKAFFDVLPKTSHAIVNVDDKNGLVMAQNCAAKLHTYALKTGADYKVKVLENSFNGLLLTINGTELWTRLIGDFNAYNLALVFGIADLLGQDSLEVLQQISTLESVDGRFQFTKGVSGITAIVDYAHTPDALENVLKTIENIRTRNEKVITVIGCGGDRDALKRPEMAKIACALSDKVILTSDNPRTENPQSILNDMEAGVEAHQKMKVLTISDREQAIKTAVSFAEGEDIVLIAGKGHEKYQEINGVKTHFDDFEMIINYLKQFNK